MNDTMKDQAAMRISEQERERHESIGRPAPVTEGDLAEALEACVEEMAFVIAKTSACSFPDLDKALQRARYVLHHWEAQS